MLSEAASKGAEGTPLADTLRRRIEVAEQWEQRGAQFLADAEEEKQSLEALEVSSGCKGHPSVFHAASFCHPEALDGPQQAGGWQHPEGYDGGLRSHSGPCIAPLHLVIECPTLQICITSTLISLRVRR